MDLTPKEFEQLLCEFCKQDLPSNFIVEHDIKDVGGESGSKRQIDTKIKGRVGISDLLICGEAKNWNEEVGSETIDALVGKYLSGEVRANKVIVFSNKGYTEPAIKRAKLLGIELLQPKEANKPIKIIPYIIAIGYIKRMEMMYIHKGPQYAEFSNVDDLKIIKGEERLTFRQNVFRLLQFALWELGHKDISDDLSDFTLSDNNVLYELGQKKGHLYHADFKIGVTLLWDYFYENLPAGILFHVNTEQDIFVNLQGHPGEVLEKVMFSATKGNYETKEELIENIISKNIGYVFISCMPDPERHRTNPENPIYSFV